MIFSKRDAMEDFATATVAVCPRRAVPLSPGRRRSPLEATYLRSFLIPLSRCHRLLCLCGSFTVCLITPPL